jgi:hypothetical protein
MVNVPDAIALLTKLVSTASALIVSVAETVIAPEYTVDEVVGVLPSVV